MPGTRPCCPTKGAEERPSGGAMGWRKPCTHDHMSSQCHAQEKGGGEGGMQIVTGTKTLRKEGGTGEGGGERDDVGCVPRDARASRRSCCGGLSKMNREGRCRSIVKSCLPDRPCKSSPPAHGRGASGRVGRPPGFLRRGPRQPDRSGRLPGSSSPIAANERAQRTFHLQVECMAGVMGREWTISNVEQHYDYNAATMSGPMNENFNFDFSFRCGCI